MKKLLLLGIIALSLLGTACKNPLVVTVFAQALPVTKTLAWDANPASDNVINYTVKLDAATVGSPVPPTTTQALTFTTLGAHVITVTATNTFGTGPASTLNVNVVIPAAPANPRIQ